MSELSPEVGLSSLCASFCPKRLLAYFGSGFCSLDDDFEQDALSVMAAMSSSSVASVMDDA